MNVAFIVQGEGRGHMTQALALKPLIESRGHHVSLVLVGKSPAREVPKFFTDAFAGIPVRTFSGLNFALGAKKRGIRLLHSLVENALRSPAFLRSLLDFKAVNGADLVVNFYEPLGGIAKGLGFITKPVIAIAHQFMFFHPAYQRLHFKRFDPNNWAMKRYTKLVGWDACHQLALSFYPEKSSGRVHVVPPVLRPELFRLRLSKEDFLLAYILNSGYAADIETWANENRVVVRCYWDRMEDKDAGFASFRKLDGRRFLEDMARCRGLFCTAGFESVSEGAFLQKPLVVCPVEGHMEQQVNARDAVFTRIAFSTRVMDLTPLIDGRARSAGDDFRQWVLQGPELFGRVFDQLAFEARLPQVRARTRRLAEAASA